VGFTVVPFGVETIRQRPGMYIGDTDRYGLYHLGYFILDVALSALRTVPTRLEVRLEADGALELVADGVPREGEKLLEILSAFTHPDPGEQFEVNRWWELFTVNTLSEVFSISWTDAEGGARWSGVRGLQTAIVREPASPAPSMTIRFKPDLTIFQKVQRFDFDQLSGKLREIAALNAGLKVRLIEDDGRREWVMQYPDGLSNWVTELSSINTAFPKPLTFEGRWGEVTIRGALQRSAAVKADAQVFSFANGVRTRGGGQHVVGMLRAIDAQADRPLRVPHEGLVAMIAVEAPRRVLVFQGPTRDVLGTEGLDVAVEEIVRGALSAVTLKRRL
jgi:DNA gyrase/topoisomerase IV subunit B